MRRTLAYSVHEMALILGPTLAQQAPTRERGVWGRAKRDKHHSNCRPSQREMASSLVTRAGKGGMGKGEERVGEAGRAGDGAAETQLLCPPHLDRAGDGAAEAQFLCVPDLDRACDGAAEAQLVAKARACCWVSSIRPARTVRHGECHSWAARGQAL